jgi:hypothetical protein
MTTTTLVQRGAMIREHALRGYETDAAKTLAGGTS